MVTGPFANKEMVTFGNCNGPLQTQSSVRNGPSSRPSGGRWGLSGSSCRLLQATCGGHLDLAARQCLANLSPFPTLRLPSTQPHCHTHPIPLHLHVVTH